MKNYYYLFETKLISRINEMNVFQTLSRVHNMISDMNDILNSFLKIMSISFTKIIIILIQIF